LGYRNACPGAAYEPGMLVLYAARTGAAERHLQPDDAILRAVLAAVASAQTGTTKGANQQGQRHVVIAYSYVLWSADGRHLALRFTAFTPSLLSTSPVLPLYAGVLLLVADGSGEPHVVLRAQQSFFPVTFEWDLVGGTGATLAMLSPAASLPADVTIPLALAYRWGPDGRLLIETPLPADARELQGRTSAMGKANGGAFFSIWQAGTLEVARGQATSLYIFSPDFPAWSPDGRYLIDSIAPIGRLEPPGEASPDPAALRSLQFDRMPLLPVRDSGLAAVLAGLSAAGAGMARGMLLAWRPDGKVLAIYASDGLVMLYDCTDGRRLKALLPLVSTPGASRGVLRAAERLRWSPDGKALLLVSMPLATVTVWNSNQLPR
jgi:hypothetical protein